MHPILIWFVVGVVAGALAKMVGRREAVGGVLRDLIIGVAGAIAGGWLFTTVLGHSYSGWIGSTFVAFVGAVVLLFILRGNCYSWWMGRRACAAARRE